MSEIDSCLTFINQVLEEVDMSTDVRDDLYKRRNKIMQRYRDPRLYLAVVGEFSSGKSTLINTFINNKLLKEAFITTTVLPTLIVDGSSSEMKVFTCQDKLEYDLSSEFDRNILERLISQKLPDSIEEEISCLTTTEKTAVHMDSVRVELAEGSIEKELCIIDTPGVNPGGEVSVKHAERTKGILNEKADAVVVLFSALQAYTQSFEDFLMENAQKEFIKNAVFILTFMDQLTQEQRDEVYEYVKDKLLQRFKLPSVILFPCSATMARTDGYWRNEFDRMKKTLMEYLYDRRRLIIELQLQRLLKELLKELGAVVSENDEELNNRLSRLRLHSTENLSRELYQCQYQVKSKYQQDKINIRNRIMNAYEANHADEKENIRNGIYACDKVYGDSYGSIPYFCKNRFPLIEKDYQNKLIKSINDELGQSDRYLNEFYDRANSVLESYRFGLGPMKAAMNKTQLAEIQPGALKAPEDIRISCGSLGNAEDIAEIVIGTAGIIVGLPLAFLDGILDTGMSDGVMSVLNKAGNWLTRNISGLENARRNTFNNVSAKLDAAHTAGREKFQKEIERLLEEKEDEMAQAVPRFIEQYRRIFASKQHEYETDKYRIETCISDNKLRSQRIEDYIRTFS